MFFIAVFEDRVEASGVAADDIVLFEVRDQDLFKSIFDLVGQFKTFRWFDHETDDAVFASGDAAVAV